MACDTTVARIATYYYLYQPPHLTTHTCVHVVKPADSNRGDSIMSTKDIRVERETARRERTTERRIARKRKGIETGRK